MPEQHQNCPHCGAPLIKKNSQRGRSYHSHRPGQACGVIVSAPVKKQGTIKNK